MVEPHYDSVYILSFTSGTTGNPKGVKTTHRMIMTNQIAVNYALDKYGIGIHENDTAISYLPYAHVFEQANLANSLMFGMKFGYYSGDPLKIVTEDLPALKPTIFPGVPRLYNRLYGVIMGKLKAAAGCKGWLVSQALQTKMANVERDGTLTHGCYDRVIFSKLAQVLGGRVRIMVTGSAPLAKEVFNFFRVAFSSQLIEGYGMTESGGASC